MIKVGKDLIKNYSLKELLSALAIGLVVSFLLVFPFVAALINAMLIYIRFVYIFLVLINFCLAVWVFLWVFFALRSLDDVYDEALIDFKKALLYFGLGKAGVVLVIGWVLIVTITPTIL